MFLIIQGVGLTVSLARDVVVPQHNSHNNLPLILNPPPEEATVSLSRYLCSESAKTTKCLKKSNLFCSIWWSGGAAQSQPEPPDLNPKRVVQAVVTASNWRCSRLISVMASKVQFWFKSPTKCLFFLRYSALYCFSDERFLSQFSWARGWWPDWEILPGPGCEISPCVLCDFFCFCLSLRLLYSPNIIDNSFVLTRHYLQVNLATISYGIDISLHNSPNCFREI